MPTQQSSNQHRMKISLYAELIGNLAISLADGSFCSILPTQQQSSQCLHAAGGRYMVRDALELYVPSFTSRTLRPELYVPNFTVGAGGVYLSAGLTAPYLSSCAPALTTKFRISLQMNWVFFSPKRQKLYCTIYQRISTWRLVPEPQSTIFVMKRRTNDQAQEVRRKKSNCVGG